MSLSIIFISPYKLLNMFRGTLFPSSGADDLAVFVLAWIVISVIFISPYKLLNMFRGTLCPSSGADDLAVFVLAWIVISVTVAS